MTRPLPLLFWTACLTILLTFVPSRAFGADAKPPQKMAFQGFLTDQSGNARGQNAAENFEITFRLYKTATAVANQAVWAEKQIVTVDKGHFSVVLGEGVLVSGSTDFAAHFSGNDTDNGRYLGITVTGETEISPRIQFFTAPYSYLSRYATELVGSSGTSVLKLGVDKVGINLVGAPSTALDVNGTVKSTGVALTGASPLELGVGVAGKQNDAGKFGYQLFTADALDIVGAGTTGSNRKVKIWAEGGTTFTGPITATGYNGPGDNLTGVAKLGDNTFTGYQEVQNELRVGAFTGAIGSGGWGDALLFGGSSPLQAGYNSDNSDPLWMARYNTAANSSELRMVIGDDPGSSADRFVIGTISGGNFSQAGTFAPLYAFRANGLLEFKPGINKEVSAGTIGYQVHSADALDIVGAGTTGSNRKITMWAEGGLTLYGGANVSGGLTLNGSQQEFYTWGIRTRREGDQARFVDFWRHDAGFSFHMYGGNTHNSGTREVRYDGDSNWDFYSDRKLKRDIVDVEPMLERAMKVQIRRYRWKEEDESAKHKLGVIAQEVQPLFPDLVTEITDRDTKEPLMTVGYSDFGLIAIKAIQELKTQHDAEVNDLKTQVADLKAQMKQVLQAAAELRGQADAKKVTASVGK